MIAYLSLPLNKTIAGSTHLFDQLQGVDAWEIDTLRCVYFSLAPWMKQRGWRALAEALRSTYGPNIRLGFATQKTTARAAALHRDEPHCTIVTPENASEFLAHLPISLLPGLGQRTTKFLQAKGVTTFESFRRLSSQTIKDWFGVSGLILQQFAHGVDPRYVDASRRFALR